MPNKRVTQLILPQGADQPDNAEAAQRRGLAVSLSPTPENREPVEAALERVLKDAALRATARAVQEEMAGLPTPHDMVERLAALT
ncbi:hypothetical protein CYFUS_003973 [Cystobacter fuscus]|uniref:Erythromycin biosynthesis protein CIII-like C-terminal domain-containing protein n=1 Tax=Cystobacter fuscus TaxID=43 RepID=A0A250J4T8_9BACT|nr:nucleotide disphospho-sugar-binding domain-containing protein [Cystobacter fuscus]ATB38538.1 hypothetical protein CYFUS_003973 [Cystobacter fuscus]